MSTSGKSSQLKAATYYLLTTVITGFGQFFFLPALTHLLSVEEYGQLSLAHAIMAFAIVLANPGIVQTFTILYFDKQHTRQGIFWNISFSYGISFLFCITMALITYTFFPGLVKISFPFFGAVLLATLIEVLFEFYRTKLRLEQKALTYMLIMISRFLLVNGLFILLLYVKAGKSELKFIVMVCVTIPFVLFFFSDLYKNFKPVHISKAGQMSIFRLAMPVFPVFFLDACSRYLDRFVISDVLDTAAVGIYEFSMQLTIPITFVAVSLMEAYRPVYYSKMSSGEDCSQFMTSQRRQIAFVLGFAAVSVAVFSGEIVEIFGGKRFEMAATLIPVLALARVLQGLNLFHDSTHYYNKKMIFLGIAGSAAVLLNLAVNLITLSLFGVQAAAFGFLAGGGVYYILSWALWRKSTSVSDAHYLYFIALMIGAMILNHFGGGLLFHIFVYLLFCTVTFLIFKKYFFSEILPVVRRYVPWK